MRFLSMLLGTAGEVLDYAMREAESPEAQEFVGGDSISLGGLLLFLLVVLVIIWIAKEI